MGKSNSKIVLGIDPGSRTTGFGLLEVTPNGPSYIESGVIQVHKVPDFANRLRILHETVEVLCERFKPDVSVIEKVFFAKDARAALKLGQARGAIIAAIAKSDVELIEVSPNEVKSSIAGYGHAKKEQVQEMVKAILKVENFATVDASDALAIALFYGTRLETPSSMTFDSGRGGQRNDRLSQGRVEGS